MVLLVTVDPANGTLQSYYEDNATVDPDDTGDQQRYGDMGLRIDEPNGEVGLDLTILVLPSQSQAVGDLYRQRATSPLAVSTSEEQLSPQPTILYVPVQRR